MDREELHVRYLPHHAYGHPTVTHIAIGTPEKIERLERFGDEMCLKYFIKPVLTLMENSLWVQQTPEGEGETCVGVSNIGGMDSGPVTVSVYDSDRKIGHLSAGKITAGPSGHTNRLVLKSTIRLENGDHTLRAVIDDAPGSTVLDGHTTTNWYWQP